MPYNCCVPQCSSVSGNDRSVMFHRFPKDEEIMRKWLIAIKSNKTPTKHTKICSEHFLPKDYTITSMGQWKILNYGTAIPSRCLPIRKGDKGHTRKRSKRLSHKQVIERQNTSNEEAAPIDLDDIARNVIVDNSLEVSTEVSEQEKQTTDISVQTVVSCSRSQLISYDFLNEKQLKEMTGVSSKIFTFLCEQFGNSFTIYQYTLTREDELLLTLMKYKLNMHYTTLASCFDISEVITKIIFIGMSEHLYKNLKKINFWNLTGVREGQCNLVLDCAEFRIERSCDPIEHQATYSTNYGTNTFKALIGRSENGSIGFVSDLYGGSISDRTITEKSGILDFLKEGDYVLAEAGFDISDLLEEKGINLNIPPFERGVQLSEVDVVKTKTIANRRIIIIENLIGEVTKNKILCDRMPKDIWYIANEIVFNCFMLENFKNSILT